MEKLNQWRIAQGQHVQAFRDADMTIADLAHQYFVAKRHSLRPSTFQKQVQLSTYLRDSDEFYGVPIINLKGWQIDAFVAEMRRKHPHLSDRTLHHLFSLVRAMLNFAVRQDYLATSPHRAATAPTIREPYRPRFLTVEESKRFIAAAKDSRYELLYLLALLCGLRVGEATALRYSDFTWPEAIVTISRSVTLGPDGRTLVEGQPKTRLSARSLPLAPQVVEAFQRHCARVSTQRPNHPNDLLFTSRSGRYVLPSTLRADLVKVCARASIPGINYHGLRHSFASSALNHGNATIRTLAEFLGHSQPSLLLNTYTHVAPADKTRLRDEIGRLFAE